MRTTNLFEDIKRMQLVSNDPTRVPSDIYASTLALCLSIYDPHAREVTSMEFFGERSIVHYVDDFENELTFIVPKELRETL